MRKGLMLRTEDIHFDKQQFNESNKGQYDNRLKHPNCLLGKRLLMDSDQ